MCLLTISNSVNCRLPQTPRTPSVGMAHYFDDVLNRQILPRSPSMPRIRRSSTARSIGARSDFDAEANGYDDDGYHSTGAASVDLPENPEQQRQKAEADEHMRNYITEQLERVKSEQVAAGYEQGDEFEAQA